MLTSVRIKFTDHILSRYFSIAETITNTLRLCNEAVAFFIVVNTSWQLFIRIHYITVHNFLAAETVGIKSEYQLFLTQGRWKWDVGIFNIHFRPNIHKKGFIFSSYHY